MEGRKKTENGWKIAGEIIIGIGLLGMAGGVAEDMLGNSAEVVIAGYGFLTFVAGVVVYTVDDYVRSARRAKNV